MVLSLSIYFPIISRSIGSLLSNSIFFLTVSLSVPSSHTSHLYLSHPPYYPFEPLPFDLSSFLIPHNIISNELSRVRSIRTELDIIPGFQALTSLHDIICLLSLLINLLSMPKGLSSHSLMTIPLSWLALSIYIIICI